MKSIFRHDLFLSNRGDGVATDFSVSLLSDPFLCDGALSTEIVFGGGLSIYYGGVGLLNANGIVYPSDK